MKREQRNVITMLMLLAIGGIGLLGWFWWKDMKRQAEIDRMIEFKPASSNIVFGTFKLEPKPPFGTAGATALQLRTQNVVSSVGYSDETRKTAGPDGIKIKRPVDAVKNEHILSFANASDMDRFVELARSRGVDSIKTLKLGNTLLIRVKSPDVLDQLMRDGPPPVEQSPNYFVRVPETPSNPIPVDSSYKPFGNDAMKWMGVQSSDSSWGKGQIFGCGT